MLGVCAHASVHCPLRAGKRIPVSHFRVGGRGQVGQSALKTNGTTDRVAGLALIRGSSDELHVKTEQEDRAYVDGAGLKVRHTHTHTHTDIYTHHHHPGGSKRLHMRLLARSLASALLLVGAQIVRLYSSDH